MLINLIFVSGSYRIPCVLQSPTMLVSHWDSTPFPRVYGWSVVTCHSHPWFTFYVSPFSIPVHVVYTFFLSQPHVVCTLFFPLGPVSFSIPIQMWSLPQVILFLSGHWVIIAHPIYSIWSLVLSRLISCHQRLQRAPILVRRFAD